MNMPIITDHQSFIISNPRERAFNLPSFSVPAKFPAILFRFPFSVRTVWAYKINTFFLQTISQLITISSFVINKSRNSFSGATSSRSRNSYLVECCFDERDFRRRGGVQVVCQRNSFTIHHHHPLRTLSAFGFSNVEPPFLAGAKLPSAKHSSHFNIPFLSKRLKYVCHALSNVPSSSHCHNRLQHVAGDGYSRGISFHRAPLRRSQRMPSKIGRLGIGFGPPFKEAFGSGKSGESFFHWSSVNSGLYRHIGKELLSNRNKSSSLLIYISSRGLV